MGKPAFLETSKAFMYFSVHYWAWKQTPVMSGFFRCNADRAKAKSSSAFSAQARGLFIPLIQDPAARENLSQEEIPRFQSLRNLVRSLDQNIHWKWTRQ